MKRIEVRAVVALSVLLLVTLGVGELVSSSLGSNRASPGTTQLGPRSWTVELLMAGTPYETPAYVSLGDANEPGALLLGGVHGDEPSGWLALDDVPGSTPAILGTLVVLPRANVAAIDLDLRSTPDLGDLNRLYGYGGDALPMGLMAREILALIQRYQLDAVLDLHESWWTPADLPDDVDEPSSAFLGQTVSPHRDRESRRLARSVVSGANRELAKDEEFTYHEFPADYEEEEIIPLPDWLEGESIPNKSSLAISDLIPGVAVVLVEVGQQQDLDARIRQQQAVIEAFLKALTEG